MTNRECYNLYNNFTEIEEELSAIYFPSKVNYYITLNLKSLKNVVQALINERNRLLSHYGSLNDEGLYQISDNTLIDKANKELNELLELEIEISIKKIPLSWLDNIDLTLPQMELLLFMVEED